MVTQCPLSEAPSSLHRRHCHVSEGPGPFFSPRAPVCPRRPNPASPPPGSPPSRASSLEQLSAQGRRGSLPSCPRAPAGPCPLTEPCSQGCQCVMEGGHATLRHGGFRGRTWTQGPATRSPGARTPQTDAPLCRGQRRVSKLERKQSVSPYRSRGPAEVQVLLFRDPRPGAPLTPPARQANSAPFMLIGPPSFPSSFLNSRFQVACRSTLSVSGVQGSGRTPA